MKPHVRRRNRARARPRSIAQSTPVTRTCPSSGVSSPPRRKRRVLFPEPLGPVTATTSPRAAARDTESTPRTSCPPPRYVRVTLSASIAGASGTIEDLAVAHDEVAGGPLGDLRVVRHREDGGTFPRLEGCQKVENACGR